MKLSIIGYGEAGHAIAQGLLAEQNQVSITCFDTKLLDPDQAGAVQQRADAVGVVTAQSLEAGIQDSDFIISTVTAASALDVARDVAKANPTVRAFFDMNSVSPGTKREEAALLEAVGVPYVDTAVMAPIHPRLHQTPMLLAGPKADEMAQVLENLNMDVRVVGNEVGRASSIKMLRSVMIKGLEALTAEMGLAAIKAGVADEVIASLNASFPGIDWEERTAYNLERMATHGIRRAEEMEEVVKTVADLGIVPELSEGTVRRQRRFGKSDLSLEGADLSLAVRSDKVFDKMKEI